MKKFFIIILCLIVFPGVYFCFKKDDTVKISEIPYSDDFSSYNSITKSYFITNISNCNLDELHDIIINYINENKIIEEILDGDIKSHEEDITLQFYKESFDFKTGWKPDCNLLADDKISDHKDTNLIASYNYTIETLNLHAYLYIKDGKGNILESRNIKQQYYHQR